MLLDELSLTRNSEVVFTHCTLAIHSPYLGEEGQNADSVAFQVLLIRDADTVADTIVFQASVTFADLQEGTVYVVYARTLCDSAHRSGWTLATFATDADTTAIAEAHANTANFTLYPNPAKEQIICQLPDAGAEEAELTIYDAMGRVVMRQHLTSSSQPISLTSLPAGLYTLTLQTGGKKFTQRLSVLR